MGKIKKIGVLTLSGLLIFSSGMLLASCSCGTGVPQVEDETAITISGNLSVKVGESTSLTASGPVEGATYLWVSDDESIATVDQTGLVVGQAEGKAKITVYDSTDFTVSSSVDVFVYKDTNAGEEIATLAIDTTNVKTVFSQGEAFTYEGLVVTKNGAEITDFTTNPKEGTILNTRGTFDVYVSCEGAVSVSYQITVEAAQEDLTLYDFVSKLSTSSIYDYTVTVNGQIDYGGDTMASKVSYTYTYGETNYYYQALADDVVIEGQDYGYTNTSKGVMKFYLRDEVVEPACYYSHDSTTYTDVIGTSMFNDLDHDLVPRRKTDDYYLITDSELISDIISNTNVESSGIYSNLETVTARCDGETLTITLDCGIMGTIEEVYANVGTANVPYIEDYLATSGEDILVDEDLENMIGLIERANYTRDLGTVKISATETVDIGQAIYTPDYMVIDYTDEYIAAALEVTGTEINDNGCYFSEADKGYYTFDIKDGKVDAESIPSKKYANGYDAYYEKVGYPNSLSAFDTLDLYEYRYIDEFGGNMYIAYGDDVPDEFFEFLGLSFESTGYIPMGFGLAYTSASTDTLPEIYLISYVNAFMTSTNGCIGITLSNFGLSQSEAVDEFLASLA